MECSIELGGIYGTTPTSTDSAVSAGAEHQARQHDVIPPSLAFGFEQRVVNCCGL
jgi:hypothetical protein